MFKLKAAIPCCSASPYLARLYRKDGFLATGYRRKLHAIYQQEGVKLIGKHEGVLRIAGLGDRIGKLAGSVGRKPITTKNFWRTGTDYGNIALVPAYGTLEGAQTPELLERKALFVTRGSPFYGCNP